MPLTKPIRLLLVDDHPVLRAGLANLLRLESDITVAGEAGSGEAAIQLCQACRPNVCLLDLSMPGLGGLDTIRRLKELSPNVAIIVLTSSESPEHANRAIEAGARAYVTKNVAFRDIVAAIRNVHGGSHGIRLGVPPGDVGTRRRTILSPRELEVLVMIRKGASTCEMARALGITERTVKFHVASILEKLAVTDRTGAVAKGFDLGLLRAEPS